MKFFLLNIIIGLLIFCNVCLAEEARLLRFPHVSQDKIAFSYGGDIYTVNREGGISTKLTTDPGLELFAKFSPDGNQIAFTGQYDGDFAVYVMPTTGGSPKKLSFHPAIAKTSARNGPENIVMGWHPDGNSILFRSRKETIGGWEGKVYLVKTSGGLPEPLPMHSAGFTSFSPDAKKVAYCPIFRDFRTWKRYKGGMAQDVWIFDLESYDAEKITDWVGTDNMPMWNGDNIYYNSDETGTLNLYCYNVLKGETRQVTNFDEYDVRWPSLGSDAIVFENGGYIYLMELLSGTVSKIPIEMISDFNSIRPEFISVSDNINDFSLSPDAKRTVFSARGDIFTVPAKEGNTRNLTNTSGVHEKSPIWSPDGKWIAYLSDETGEDEIFLISQDGTKKKRLTHDGHCFRYIGSWSPDSKKLIFEDKNQKIFYVNIKSGDIVLIDQNCNGGIGEHNWSPDSRYIVYDKNLDNDIRGIIVYSIEDGTKHQITPGFTNDYGAVFDPDGKYIYFLSQRSFNPVLSNYEFQFVNTAITNLYMILLHEDDKSPFIAESDEVTVIEAEDGTDEKKSDSKKDDESEKKPKNISIDFDNIYDRQIAFDLSAGNYYGLSAISGSVFYMNRPIRGLRGKVTEGKAVLHKYDITDKKDNEFSSGVSGYAFDAKGSKMLILRKGAYNIVGTSEGEASFKDNSVDISHMNMKLDRRVEYKQIFNEVWRRNRDFFYDENMHGVDWIKMHDRYASMLPYVTHRFDLTYILGEMIGELCCSHTYIGGGDFYKAPSSNVGLLGCDFEIDKKNNRIKIVNILNGENWSGQLRSPLTETHINVNEGDYLLAIDGKEITADINPYELTQNKGNQKITLTINEKNTMKNAREIVIEPITSEITLRYYKFVENNRII